MTSEQSFNFNLVQEIEKYPCLYNYKLSAYSYKDVTDKAWSDVGKAVNLSVSECKERWKNLRAVYVRHKKQALNGTAPRKPYYLEEAMEFTLPYIKTLNSISGNTSASYEGIYDDQDEDNSSNQRQSPDPYPTGVSSPPSPQQSQSKKRSNEEKFDIPEYFRSKISRVQDNVDVQRESNSLFLLSLLPDLNGMSNQQVRTFKRKVLELIDEVLETNTGSTTSVKVEPLY
ncbi:uncharacterized protein LOC123873191 [Maniola jurtina]|uniref:uncharacterized protein LOC123873191 n=1 Tax=Maniola jurtina TaxID=191418 RepID=UPI001E686EE4|nr:uncharacterized protein LOC123873191 [Maniola jurtina]